MRLESLTVDRSPGTAKRRQVDADAADLVLIAGSNESGKSSLVRVVRQMLWGGDWAPVDAQARWSLDGRRFECALRDAWVSWHDESGAATDPPRGLRAETAAWYVLRIDELAAAADGDATATEAARLLAGGVDIAAAASARAPERGTLREEGRQLREADEQVRELRTREAELRRREDDLQTIQTELAEVATQMADADRVLQARTLVELRGRVQAATEQLQRFPDGIDRLAGTELDELEQLQAEHAAIEQRRSSHAESVRALSEHAGALAAPIPDEAATAVRRCIEQVGRARDDTRAAREAATEAQVRLRALEQELGRDPQRLAGLDAAAAAVDEAAQLVEAASNIAARRARLEAAAPGPHRGGTATPLARWLPLFAVCIVAASLVALDRGAGWWALAAIAALAAVPLVRRPVAAGDRGPTAHADPGLNTDEQALAERRTRLAEALGPAPDSAAALVTVARVAAEYVTARAEAAAAAEKLEITNARCAEAEQQLLDLAESHGALASADVDPCDIAEALLEASVQADRHQRDLAEAARAEKLANEELERWESRWAAFCERCGINPDSDARAELAPRLAARDAWREARRAHDAAAMRLEEAELTAAGDPRVQELSRNSRAELAALPAELDRLRERQLALAEQRSAIETELRHARASGELEAALARRQAARDALADASAAHARQAILERVADWIAEQAQQATGTTTTAADVLLARMTGGRWRLVARRDGRNLRLAARDSSGAVCELSELSTATRIQVLIAARLGFVETLEDGGVHPPVFLDEAFSNFDQERRLAAAAAVAALARESGRQLIYLTADPHDLLRITEAVQADQDGRALTVATINLDEQDFVAGTPVAPPQRVEPPTPGESLVEYLGRVGTTVWDPSAPIGAAPAWLVCGDDAGLWAAFNERRIDTVGAMRHLHTHGLLEPVLPPGSCGAAELLARARALEALHSTWQHGRPPRLADGDLRAAMQAARMDIKRWFDPFRAVAADTATGTAAALLDELRRPAAERDDRLKGRSETVVDRLEDAFRHAGLIDDRAPATITQAHAEVTAVMPDIAPTMVEWWWDLAEHSRIPALNR